MPKNALFLLKSRKNRRALGARWGLRSQTPGLAPHDEILATRLVDVV